MAGQLLVEWARGHGARVHDALELLRPQPTGDRSCFTTASLAEGTVLARLPRNLVLEVEGKPLGVDPEVLEDLRSVGGYGPPSLPVALLVSSEYRRADSAFATYLETLPKDFPTMPLLDEVPPWEAVPVPSTADEPWIYAGTGVSFLAKSGGLSSAAGLRALARAAAELKRPAPERWVAAAVQSRAHARQGGGTVLIPLADSFNHSASVANCEVQQKDEEVLVVTTTEVKAGDELLLCYGRFSNAELLYNAGFTVWPNEHDFVLLPLKALMEAAQDLQGGAPLGARLSPMDTIPSKLSARMPLLGAGVPAETMTLLTSLLLEEEQWEELQDSPGGLHDAWVNDRHLRAAAVQCLLHALRSSVEPRYKDTSLASDLQHLEKAEASGQLRRLNALRVRVGERQVLRRLEAALAARLEDAPAKRLRT